ncbi:MAG: hypothetical protein A3K65_00955 [Euryarchaeota archaeon RBG_16_68_12]|nr:MAG: hypothetical protein A3K65_00955 [Euryarchaeota archaeon RBG_16_68_12]
MELLKPSSGGGAGECHTDVGGVLAPATITVPAVDRPAGHGRGCEAAAAHLPGWLPVASVAILAPLAAYWRGIVRLSRSEETPRTRVVRRVRFAQSGNMIAWR